MTGSNEPEQPRPPASVADPYRDLLATLGHGRRQGLVQQLAAGYYEGWRPSRTEVAELIAGEGGSMTGPDREALFELARSPQDPTLITPWPSARPIHRQTSPVRFRAPLATAVGSTPEDRDATAPVRPRAMLSFTISCAGLAPSPGGFVARGMSSGAWLTRGNRMCRLVALHYELTLPVGSLRSAVPTAFTGAILCRPDSPAPHEPGDGEHAHHSVRSGRLLGVRGHWPISPNARRIGFLIYPQSLAGDVAEHHPAGTLLVDLTTNRAQWCPVSGLRTEAATSGEQRSAPG